jgi:hypothetical protein
MRVNLADAPWRWERVLSRRLFQGREFPSESALRLYRKQWTPGMPTLRLKHAG